jgi:hypothetical protein
MKENQTCGNCAKFKYCKRCKKIHCQDSILWDSYLDDMNFECAESSRWEGRK